MTPALLSLPLRPGALLPTLAFFGAVSGFVFWVVAFWTVKAPPTGIDATAG